jgi:hypothetical protein
MNEQGPTVLQVGDHDHADHAGDQLSPAITADRPSSGSCGDGRHEFLLAFLRRLIGGRDVCARSSTLRQPIWLSAGSKPYGQERKLKVMSRDILPQRSSQSPQAD